LVASHHRKGNGEKIAQILCAFAHINNSKKAQEKVCKRFSADFSKPLIQFMDMIPQ
jgi:hypothetical protein